MSERTIMSISKIKPNPQNPRTIRNDKFKKLVDKRLKDSLEVMARDIQAEARRREPPQAVKDTIANKIKRLIAGHESNT